MAAKRVALLVETASSWGSQIIAGIADFVRRHERWMLYLDHRGVYENQNVPREWPSDGIIARVTSERLAGERGRLKIPFVTVSQIRVPMVGVQQVTTNELRVGELAAETLISAGVKHFGYYGPPRREHYIDNVFLAYRRCLALATFDCQ